MCDNFQEKWDNFHLNGFWGRNFKNLSVDLESVPPRCHVCQFSGKTNNFDFFHQNSGKLLNTCDILVLILVLIMSRVL